MGIGDVTSWTSVLILCDVEENSNEAYKKFTLALKELNPNLMIDMISWQANKKLAKSKEYVRQLNELNPTDFSIFSRIKNEHIHHYFRNNYDVRIIFPTDLPDKVWRLVELSSQSIKIGFSTKITQLDVVLSPVSNRIDDKVQLLYKYILKTV